MIRLDIDRLLNADVGYTQTSNGLTIKIIEDKGNKAIEIRRDITSELINEIEKTKEKFNSVEYENEEEQAIYKGLINFRLEDLQNELKQLETSTDNVIQLIKIKNKGDR
jgi:hypothetical protein